MKIIKLPITNTLSMTLDSQNAKTEVVNGMKMIKFGVLDVAASHNELEVVRDNGAQILYAVLSIERRIESTLSNYLFGFVLGTPKPERDFFNNEIVQTDKITFSFKINLLNQIITTNNFLSAEDKNQLVENLNLMMHWRNAFAHGHLNKDNLRGVELHYYSGGNKVFLLDDVFWGKVESCFVATEELWKKFDSLFEPYLKKRFP